MPGNPETGPLTGNASDLAVLVMGSYRHKTGYTKQDTAVQGVVRKLERNYKEP